MMYSSSYNHIDALQQSVVEVDLGMPAELWGLKRDSVMVFLLEIDDTPTKVGTVSLWSPVGDLERSFQCIMYNHLMACDASQDQVVKFLVNRFCKI